MIAQSERLVSGSTVKEIVNTHCEDLLQKMQSHLPDADVGMSVALFCPEDPDAPTPIRPDGEPTAFSMGLGWQIPTFDTAEGPVPVLAKNGSTGRGGCNCWVGLARYSPSRPPVGLALMTNQVGVSPDSTARTSLQEILDLQTGR